MRRDTPIRRRIVLIGGGHSHVTVLRSFGMKSEPGVALTLIAKEIEAPYSGMLPGFVAGHYTYDDCHIDLVRLAAFAGARVVHGAATGIDRVERRVHIAGRAPLAYDALSIDTGITPLLDDIAGASEFALAVKPISEFAPRWAELEARVLQADGPRRFVVIGTGAAGFEIVLAMRHRFRTRARTAGIDANAFSFALLGSGELLPTHSLRARQLALAELASAGVELIQNDAAVSIDREHVRLASGRVLPADAVVATTKAAPPAWFRDTGLALDAQGFIEVRETLQTRHDDAIFAVGDCASMLASPREKAGVFAVRQGPALAENLRLHMQGKPLQPFRPQKHFLTILSLGDRRAIAARNGLAFSGALMWSWKDHIDRKFMQRFDMAPTAMMGEATDDAMRCGGCAAKIGPQGLANALVRLPPTPESVTVRDAIPGDDAALLDMGGGHMRLETVDFFRAFWPEPYLFGQIAAVHAMSDVFAKGSRPDHAMAIAVLPYAAPRQNEDDLFQLMAGARAAFDGEGVALVGGHSSEGPELGAGFFVSGPADQAKVMTKDGLRPGDVIVLTKPIGTGILFAGLMRGKARGRDITAALAMMQQSNAAAARVLVERGATACTDVTGFGLAGHLIEMLEASRAGAQIDLASMPLLAGVFDMSQAGVHSTLLPENMVLADRLSGPAAASAEALTILFDPQTSGGLLAGVPEDQVKACLDALNAERVEARVIGKVVQRVEGQNAILAVRGALQAPDSDRRPPAAI